MDCVRGRPWLLTAALAALGVIMLLLGAGLHDAHANGGAAVTIVDFAFEPDLTGIAVGDTVTWINDGASPHTVTADASLFTSGSLAPGESFSQTFARAGSFTYRCRMHPSMTGTIVVNGGRETSGKGTGGGMEAVPVVGVGTAASGQSGGLALVTGLAAVVLGAAALALRRA